MWLLRVRCTELRVCSCACVQLRVCAVACAVHRVARVCSCACACWTRAPALSRGWTLHVCSAVDTARELPRDDACMHSPHAKTTLLDGRPDTRPTVTRAPLLPVAWSGDSSRKKGSLGAA